VAMLEKWHDRRMRGEFRREHKYFCMQAMDEIGSDVDVRS
jgi:hypothetical protein